MGTRSYDFMFKLLLIGDAEVGKTCLIKRYVEGSFSPHYEPTTGMDFKVKTIQIGQKRIKVQIWDTSGNWRFHTITTGYYKQAHGIMLVYDVTKSKTFENVLKWSKNIEEYGCENVRMILVGNKSELTDQMEITETRAAQFAQENKIKSMHVSANTGFNVEEIFRLLIADVLSANVSEQDQLVQLSGEGRKKSSCSGKSK